MNWGSHSIQRYSLVHIYAGNLLLFRGSRKYLAGFYYLLNVKKWTLELGNHFSLATLKPPLKEKGIFRQDIHSDDIIRVCGIV